MTDLIEAAKELAPHIRRGLDEVRERVKAAASSVGRDAEEITIVVVTKGRAPEVALGSWLAGARVLGENRADELGVKASTLAPVFRALSTEGVQPPEWHFIGHLQRNKVKRVAGLTTMIHSLDSLRLAEEIMKRSVGGEGKIPACLLQVNISGERQKYGIDPEDAGEFISNCPVPVRGLMCMAPEGAGYEDARAVFSKLAMLRKKLAARFAGTVHGQLPVLSMGMSDDFEAAVVEGATILRIGRAVFADLS